MGASLTKKISLVFLLVIRKLYRSKKNEANDAAANLALACATVIVVFIAFLAALLLGLGRSNVGSINNFPWAPATMIVLFTLGVLKLLIFRTRVNVGEQYVLFRSVITTAKAFGKPTALLIVFVCFVMLVLTVIFEIMINRRY